MGCCKGGRETPVERLLRWTHQFRDRSRRDPKLARNRTNPQPGTSQIEDLAPVSLDRIRPTKLHAARPGGLHAGLYALPNNLALELRHSHQNIQLQPANWVIAARVDSLAGADQRH